jgi:uncharacterized protein YdaU (DUF1376 family)
VAENAPREWLAFYVLHYLADTSDLTFEQHGAYAMTLWVAWTRGGSLPADTDGCRRALAAHVKDCGTKRFNNVVIPILERFFFRDENGLWRNKKLEKEMSKCISISASSRKAANSRWGNPSDYNGRPIAPASQPHCGGNAKHTNNNNYCSTSSGRGVIPSFANDPLHVSQFLSASIRGGTK